MTTEEKAKRYDEALKVAVAAHKDEDKHLKATLERIFPELKESEDEKIRKALINKIKRMDNEEDFYADDYDANQLCTWLEKQGQQKSDEWSEEDERKLQLLIVMCDETKGNSVTYSTIYREMEELKTWLKSLKDRYTWKYVKQQ